MIYYQEPIEKLLPFLTKQEINNIEIRSGEGHFHPQEIKDLLRLKKKLDQRMITVKAIHMPINGIDISHPQEYERIKSVREVEKDVLIAYHLGVDLVVVHPGAMMTDSSERDKRLKLCIDSLKEIVEFSQNWNVKIALENTLPGRVGNSWEEIKKIIEIVSYPNLGICFDCGHHLLNYQKITQEGLDLEKIPINWQECLFHAHIHDNDAKHDFHWLPGEGQFPWTSFITFLKKIGYQGTLIFEPKKQNELSDYLNKIKTFWKEINN